ncbi:hypothetical protein GGC64_004764 [Mycobacterium sp. OAS707]|nr:hypothetical protein [Mycobacterium sp. OAS707]
MWLKLIAHTAAMGLSSPLGITAVVVADESVSPQASVRVGGM